MAPESDSNEATLTDGQSPATIDQSTLRAKANLIGKTLGGRYLIEQELARGGMGVVYLARDKPAMLSRRVVIKVLLEDSLKDEWVVKKFNQEIESLTRLDDPGVVGIFDAGTLDDGSPFLVMQYVDGSNLRTVLKPEGMDFERAANIIRQIGRTLTVAHDQGIVHRDLKPENIMLRTLTGGEEQVKVIDFGIAKVTNSAIAPTTVTGAGVAGTVIYMSPEQLGARSIAAASDIYAFGLISYEMLVGRRPFNPETSFQLSEMQKQGVQVSPKALRPALPEKAANVILSALSYSPSDRPQRAKDFCDDLAKALTEDDALVATVDPEEDRKTLSKRQDKQSGTKPSLPVWMIVAAVLLVAGIIGTVVWLRPGSGNNQQANIGSTNATPATVPQRTLTYSLTVRKPDGEEFESIGQEPLADGWSFRVNITPAQSGSLYMLNEFSGPDGAPNYSVLFPTPANNNGSARLEANRKFQTRQNFVRGNQGTMKFWVIWSAEPLSSLENIFKDNMIISNPAQTSAVRDVLARYESSKPQVEIDKANRQITLESKGDVLVSLLELKRQ